MEDKNHHEKEAKIFSHESCCYDEKNNFTDTRNHNSPNADNTNKNKSKHKNILIHSIDIKELKRPITRGTLYFKENKLSMIKNSTSDVNTNENIKTSKKINKINVTKLRKRGEFIIPLTINTPLQRDYKGNSYKKSLKKSSEHFKDSKLKISQNPTRIFKSNFIIHHFSPEQKLRGNTVKLPIKIASQKEFIPLDRNAPININIKNININNYNFPFINDTRKMTPSNRHIDKNDKFDNTRKKKKKIIDINFIDDNNDSFINELNEILKEVDDDSKLKDSFKNIEVNLNKYNYTNVNSRPMTSYGGIDERMKSRDLSRRKSMDANIQVKNINKMKAKCVFIIESDNTIILHNF